MSNIEVPDGVPGTRPARNYNELLKDLQYARDNAQQGWNKYNNARIDIKDLKERIQVLSRDVKMFGVAFLQACAEIANMTNKNAEPGAKKVVSCDIVDRFLNDELKKKLADWE